MDGSIHERINAKDKKVYDVMYRVLDPKTGKKKQKLKRGFSKKGDAQKFLNKILGQIENNSYVEATKMKLSDFLNEWLEKFVEGKLAANTVRGYKVNINNHVIPSIGGLPLQQLTTRDIQSFYDGKLKDPDEEDSEGLSAKSIIYIHRNLRKALDYAVKERYIISNPAKDVELPSQEKFTGMVYDQKTMMKLLDAVKDTDMELPIALAGLSGLRRGETAGLLWDEVDFENKTLSVRKQRISGSKGAKRSKVKTSESYRCIRISNTLLEILERHKKRQELIKNLLGNDYKGTEEAFVCCEADGSLVDASNYSKRFSKILEANDLPMIRFHDLRHSWATNMIRLGVPVNTVSKMLGHSNPVIILTVYAHVLNEMQDEAVDKLDADIEKYIDAADGSDKDKELEENKGSSS